MLFITQTSCSKRQLELLFGPISVLIHWCREGHRHLESSVRVITFVNDCVVVNTGYLEWCMPSELSVMEGGILQYTLVYVALDTCPTVTLISIVLREFLLRDNISCYPGCVWLPDRPIVDI